MFDYETYLSPYTWRYSSEEMRRVWSEAHKRRLWRRIWLALAETEAEYGLIRPEQVHDLQQHVEDVNIPRSLEIEAEIHHDLMAEVRAFAEQSPVGGGVIHLGATSMDIEDNTDALRLIEALDLTLTSLRALLAELSRRIDQWAGLPVMAFTHLQPAEPSTLGYRLAQYGQDLLADWTTIQQARESVRGKGFKGAVGTGASYGELIGLQNQEEFEAKISARLGLAFYPVATQTYPRKQDYTVLSALAGLGASLYKMAFDLRFLQSPPVGEWSEPFGRQQVGSSAMPFKRNPINAEKIDSLARLLAQAPRVAWDNAAHSLLERTLDESANRRSLLPESFLIADEILGVSGRILHGLQINDAAIQRNLDIYGPFAAVERVLMAAAKAGGDRQLLHERLRQHSMSAWAAIQQGGLNPLAGLLANDSTLAGYVAPDKIQSLMDASQYVGNAPDRARQMADLIRSKIG